MVAAAQPRAERVDAKVASDSASSVNFGLGQGDTRRSIARGSEARRSQRPLQARASQVQGRPVGNWRPINRPPSPRRDNGHPGKGARAADLRYTPLVATGRAVKSARKRSTDCAQRAGGNVTLTGCRPNRVSVGSIAWARGDALRHRKLWTTTGGQLTGSGADAAFLPAVTSTPARAATILRGSSPNTQGETKPPRGQVRSSPISGRQVPGCPVAVSRSRHSPPTVSAPACATGPALDLLLPDSRQRLRAAQHGDTVSPELAEAVEKTVRQARDLDDRDGSTPTLQWAGGIWQNLATLIVDSRYSDHIGIRLHTAMIELSETYGWMLFDAGHHPHAQRVYQTGVRVAREAHDADTVHHATTNLLASAAYQAAWLDQYREAGDLLEVAEHRRPQTLTPHLRAVVAMRRIALAGQRGDTDALYRADQQTREHLTSTGTHEPWWTLWLSPSAVNAQTGRALLAAHRPDLAEPYLRDRSDNDDAGYPRDRMLFASELAAARIQIGDLPGALTSVRTALTLAREVRSRRVHRHLDGVLTTLRRDHSTKPDVRPVLDRLALT